MKVRVAIYDSLDPKALKDNRLIYQHCFNRGKKQISFLERGIRNAHQPKTVILYGQRDQVLGAGSVFTKGSYSYLFSGGILPRYRGRGLWQVLLSARQHTSSALGAKHWVFNTATDRLLKKYDKRFYNHALM